MNTGVNLRKFPYQLTRALPYRELLGMAMLFHKYYGADTYGETYVIKKDMRSGKFAIFTKGDKLDRRDTFFDEEVEDEED